MLAKQCPWCGNRPTLSQLGRRPVKRKPRWYQFSRTVQVCPYCAGAVKPAGKAMWFLVLLLPSFLSLLSGILLGYGFLAERGLEPLGWGLFLAAFAGVFLFCRLAKVEND